MEGTGKRICGDQARIIYREEHWKIRRLKETVHMLCYSDLLSSPSIEMNTIRNHFEKNSEKMRYEQ